jgi:fructose-1-phosphate kinase PfkB-like protein
VIIADQVQEADCGVITERVRDELSALAQAYPTVAFLADSRVRIGLFEDIILKPNAREAASAIDADCTGEPDRAAAEAAAAALYARTGQPVLLTLGGDGILAFHADGPTRIPAVPVTGPIDIVGAGDATMAGIASALCAGATVAEAAQIGCLASAVTIRQLGTTGTASREQIAACFEENGLLESHQAEGQR